MRIEEESGHRKAYDALTDPVAKRNYRLYGNPDGPVRVELSVALPSVDKELGRGHKMSITVYIIYKQCVYKSLYSKEEEMKEIFSLMHRNS